MTNNNLSNSSNTNIKSDLKEKLLPLKYTYIMSCVILMINGAFISIGSVMIWKNLHYFEKFVSYYTSIPILIVMIVGVIIIALSWFGIISAWLSYYCGLLMFYMFTSLLFVSTVAGWAYLYYVSDSNLYKKNLLHTLVNATINYHFEEDAINIVQAKLQCCGVHSYADWETILGYIPGSCCESNDFCNYNNGFNVYNQGCYIALNRLIESYTLLLHLVVVITEGFFVLSISLSYYLYQKPYKHKQFISYTQRRNIELSQNNPRNNHSAYPVGLAAKSFSGSMNII
ncbi:tetraspanin-6-like isoform X1 [Nasonia vitripennis]|uniref:Tetraspanin n=2 Tax=Nasonia vitripennis TaxID=7425 RepID=A0A7M7QH01_NASVI|nr:tetraspanin-6-like isoform X1 [Nasonia vitripennis]